MLRKKDQSDVSSFSSLSNERLFKPWMTGYERSEETQRCVNFNFSEIISKTEHVYTLTGAEEYSYCFCEKIFLNVSSIVNAKIKNNASEPFIFLDIGAGNFELQHTLQDRFESKIQTYGISASDNFRQDKNELDEFHVVGNAENLGTVFPEQSFDLIASRATFVHFVDTVGSLIAAYSKLKPGGTLLIDILYIPGCENYLDKIISHLQSKKYLIVAEANHKNINPFLIQKPKDGTLSELTFPVFFHKMNELNYVEYKPHPDVFNTLEFKKHDNLNEFHIQSKTYRIAEQLKQMDIYSEQYSITNDNDNLSFQEMASLTDVSAPNTKRMKV